MGQSMTNHNVVQLPNRHRDMSRGDDMYAYTVMIGKTLCHVDDSYLRTRTPEQERIDKEMLDEAMWAIAEELAVEETA